ncbi:hypothetical protein ACHAXH_007761, partial [Discostella pseudostelligera]
QERPYHGDSTASRLLSEVKHRRARLVLRWGTTLESLVFFAFRLCTMTHAATSTKNYSYLLQEGGCRNRCNEEQETWLDVYVILISA